MAATDYFQGLYQTARRPDELLVEALIPVQRPASVSVFGELAQRHGDFAIAGVAFHLQVDRRTVTDARLVYFGSEDKPTVAQGTGAAIIGHRLDDAERLRRQKRRWITTSRQWRARMPAAVCACTCSGF